VVLLSLLLSKKPLLNLGLYHMQFVAHRALCERLVDARFVLFCSLVSVIVRGFPPALLSLSEGYLWGFALL